MSDILTTGYCGIFFKKEKKNRIFLNNSFRWTARQVIFTTRLNMFFSLFTLNSSKIPYKFVLLSFGLLQNWLKKKGVWKGWGELKISFGSCPCQKACEATHKNNVMAFWKKKNKNKEKQSRDRISSVNLWNIDIYLGLTEGTPLSLKNSW